MVVHDEVRPNERCRAELSTDRSRHVELRSWNLLGRSASSFCRTIERKVSIVGKINSSAAKGCGILAAVVVGVPLLVVGVVGVKTWMPLQEADEAMDALDRSLGPEATYIPAPSGEIPADRMELFLELRHSLVTACDDYGAVRKGFDKVEALEAKDPRDAKDPKVVGEVAFGLGGAALAITPFLARFFERRNEALLETSMGLQEYSYIYAAAYHDLLLSEQTRQEIFSDGNALSPEASIILQGCLTRQLEGMGPADTENSRRLVLESELKKMEEDSSRLVWQDGLPDAVQASVIPFREQLDRMFCGATAGLEMERSARRALQVALE